MSQEEGKGGESVREDGGGGEGRGGEERVVLGGRMFVHISRLPANSYTYALECLLLLHSQAARSHLAGA